MEHEAVIGLEVHAQLLTRSKIFCRCSTRFGAPANSHTCPVCLGLPGALPVLNREAVTMAMLAGLALGCRINRRSVFARKNYFYPDLPKGYQISQYEAPLAEDGLVEISGPDQSPGGGSFRIIRVHLEEDAGKSIHAPGRDSLVNLNRTGVPLIEIVTHPDFRTPRQCRDFLVHLRRTLLYLEVCDGNMEQGSLRCDANVSVRPRGDSKLGTKTEIKNLNSFRFLERALEYEVERQIGAARRGEALEQETRLWDEEGERTLPMRTKEEAHDYRYFPEPDLLPLEVSREWLERTRARIPELPEIRRRRLMEQHGLSHDEAWQLTRSRQWADYFEAAAASCNAPRAVANWMTGELTFRLKQEDRELARCSVPPRHLASLVRLIEEGRISRKMGKQVFEKMYQSGADPETLVSEMGLSQVSDEAILEEVIDAMLESHAEKVEAYRAGKHGLMGFFVGQVMKETDGQANPRVVNRILKRKLQGQ